MLLVVVVTVGNKDQTRSNPVEELTISFKQKGMPPLLLVAVLALH